MDTSHNDTGPTLTARNAQLGDLVQILRAQHAATLDVVACARELSVSRGNLLIANAGQPILTPDGVTSAEAILAPTTLADADIADKLKIPTTYLRRLRAENIKLYDANVGGWLEHDPRRRFLLRGLVDSTSGAGVLRAMLSDSFRILDNLDVLMSVLDGITEADVQVDITSADLTESRMYVKVACPQIAEYAPDLLRGYISPFTGARGADNPTVFAGLVISNSEVGRGSFSITPQLTVQICNNGMTLTEHVLREVHLGGRLPAGVIAWSEDTQQAALALVTKQTRDAVRSFLHRDFVRARLTEIQNAAGVAIADTTATLAHVGKQLRYSTAAQDTILAHFISGAERTSGGVLHAVTSAAQTLIDADEAYELERSGIRAMHLAATFAGP